MGRSDNGYRCYGESDVHRLRFVRRGRALGFSMLEISELLGLWSQRRRSSAQVKRIAQAHVDDLQQRIASLQGMQQALQSLLNCCPGNEGPDCPILEDLAGDQPPEPRFQRKSA